MLLLHICVIRHSKSWVWRVISDLSITQVQSLSLKWHQQIFSSSMETQTEFWPNDWDTYHRVSEIGILTLFIKTAKQPLKQPTVHWNTPQWKANSFSHDVEWRTELVGKVQTRLLYFNLPIQQKRRTLWRLTLPKVVHPAGRYHSKACLASSHTSSPAIAVPPGTWLPTWTFLLFRHL